MSFRFKEENRRHKIRRDLSPHDPRNGPDIYKLHAPLNTRSGRDRRGQLTDEQVGAFESYRENVECGCNSEDA